MSDTSKLSQLSFSDLEEKLRKLTQMQKDHLALLFDLAETKARVQEAKLLAQIEAKVYSGIKRFFKKDNS